jgi:hypothetical protein
MGDTPIEVNLSTLGQFAKALRDEVDQNYYPQARTIIETIDARAAPFAAPGDCYELLSAHDQYGYCRDGAIELLAKYGVATEELAMAAELIAKRYADSDAFVAAQVADVQDAIRQVAGSEFLNG